MADGGNALALIKTVLGLRADRRTGVLDVHADGLRTHVYFDAGKPVFAEDGTLGETFGRLLVRQGVITTEQFVEVIDEMSRAAPGDDELRFGEVAARRGFLTQAQVERGLADQVRGIIVRALQRDGSRWEFDPSASGATPPRSYAIDVESMVLEAMRRLRDHQSVEEVVTQRADAFVVLASEPRTLAKRFDMSSLELGFLMMVDGSKTARELLRAEATLPDVDVSALLATLILAGAVALLPQAAYGSTSVGTDSGSEAPPTGGAPAVQDRKRDSRGPSGPAHKERILAEQTFQKGVALLRAKDWAPAAVELRRASELQPDSLEYALLASWAEARGRSDEPSEPDKRMLLELARKALKRDPMLAFASYVLGQLSMWADDEAAAKKAFYEALRLDPALPEAQEQARILARREARRVAPSSSSLRVPASLSLLATAPVLPVAVFASAELEEPDRDAPAAHDPRDAGDATDAVDDGAVDAGAVGANAVDARNADASAARDAPEPPSSRPWTTWLALGILVLAGAGLAMRSATRTAAPTPEALPPAAAVPTSAVADAQIAGEPLDLAVADSAATDAAPTASDAAANATAASDEQDSATTGIVRLPAHSAGHRVFVDGRVEADAGAELRLPCGRHVLQIGSRGAPRAVEVPCRGAVRFE